MCALDRPAVSDRSGASCETPSRELAKGILVTMDLYQTLFTLLESSGAGAYCIEYCNGVLKALWVRSMVLSPLGWRQSARLMEISKLVQSRLLYCCTSMGRSSPPKAAHRL